jgi:hypothetical protein
MHPKYLARAAALTVVLAVADRAPAADPTPPPGFTALFNGKDFSGWYGWAVHEKGFTPPVFPTLPKEEREKKVAAWTEDAKKHWSIVDGALVNDGKGAYLATEKEYGDYELLIEYKMVPGADSGIYLKATPQVQVWDPTTPDPQGLGKALGSGGLWNNAKGSPGKDPLARADRPVGEWNEFRIVQVGARTTIHLNDVLVIDHATLENYYDKGRPLLAKAPIVLQTHPGEMRWRNIFVREIPPAEANKRLLAGSGFRPLFDGKTLDGWAGATGNYEVRNGAIVCKPGKGGMLHTKDVFADFVARVEYKLPPAGNNGLAIRFPGGQGDTAYEGMCEVQILDDADPKYAKIDPRQACGSVYGMIPAARGYQRPVGEWNVMEVTVRGPKIQVEINGNRVVDGDVSQVKEFMANRPHPGKDRPEGHFGFAGHGDPVEFRTVMIKPLGK